MFDRHFPTSNMSYTTTVLEQGLLILLGSLLFAVPYIYTATGLVLHRDPNSLHKKDKKRTILLISNDNNDNTMQV